MLAKATAGGAIGGSEILLTAGVPDPDPDPDTNGQTGAIQHDLIPQFKAHNWPIATVALGGDTRFHDFLGGVANATSGSFYDDDHSVVPGVSVSAHGVWDGVTFPLTFRLYKLKTHL